MAIEMTQRRRDLVIHVIAKVLHTFLGSFSASEKAVDPLGISHGDVKFGRRLDRVMNDVALVVDELLGDPKAGRDMLRYIEENMSGGTGMVKSEVPN